MKTLKYFAVLIVVSFFMNACSDDIDTEKPSID